MSLLSWARKRPTLSMTVIGAVFIGSLAVGAAIDVSHRPPTNHEGAYRVTPVEEDRSVGYADGSIWDPNTRTFYIRVDVEETGDVATDRYNVMLAHTLRNDGYAGLPADGCDCFYVPEDTRVIVLGYGEVVIT